MIMEQILLGVLVLAMVFVTASATIVLVHTALADPWSWGNPPSQNWLRCYHSGAEDCSNIW
jgi:hypothetical protein